MAGGPNARRVACLACLLEGELNPAERTYEGIETDWYECPRGHRTGTDWSRSGGPSEPAWPPDAETVAFAERRRRERAEPS